jgi:4-carboxymuconolactone decarboxylase
MLKSNRYLGRRLRLLDPKVLSSDQHDLYQRLDKTMISWAMATGFQGKTEDGCLIGPFNPILYSPGISTAFMDLHDAEEAHTSIDEQVRQVVILAVGSVWGTDYERYAHAAAARKAGLSDDAIAALSAKRKPSNLSEPALIAANFAHELSSQHAVSDNTYRAAVGGLWRERDCRPHFPDRHLSHRVRLTERRASPSSGITPD